MTKTVPKAIWVLLRILLCFSCIIIEWLFLELSMVTLADVAARPLFSNMISLCVVLAVNALIGLLLGRLIPALVTGLCLSSMVSIINIYVLTLHGAPLRASEVANFSTAMAVITGFRFFLPKTAAVILLVAAAAIVILLMIEKRSQPKIRPLRIRLVSLIFLFSAILLIRTGFQTDVYRPTIGFSWDYAAQTYGYPACLVEDTIKFRNCIEEPEGYSSEIIHSIAGDYSSRSHERSSAELPDIVLILNETFYDPRVHSDLNLETDIEFLPYFYGLTGVMRGQTIVPTGGTNASEYELLTSNSTSMINASAPFNFLALKNANSIVSYLKSLGYETWAMHQMSGKNYSRNTGYYDLGFDHVLFQEDYTFDESYGNRIHTDRANYMQLMDAYGSSGDKPQFFFLLTFQNHGGWEQNDAELDTVHSLTDYGDKTDDMDELLSSLYLSDLALKELLDYFSETDRHIITIMAGDHAAFLIHELPVPEKQEVVENMVNLSTPYLIWSNYMSFENDQPYISLVDLVPLALARTNMPLSPFYQETLLLLEKAPFRRNEYAADPAGRILADSTTSYEENICSRYLYMEYNNLQNDSKRIDSLFYP